MRKAHKPYQLNAVQWTQCPFREVVACVVGRVSLRCGRGSILGALTGASIIVILANEALLLGVAVQSQLIIKGVVIGRRELPGSALYRWHSWSRLKG
jgi:ribose/xylose/arabinose/galactoside ABC-type transport system permease subunit